MFLLGLCTSTYSVHASILKPWIGSLPWLPATSSSCHVFPLLLSGLNWRTSFPPGGPGPPPSKMVLLFTGSAHTPLPGSGTVLYFSFALVSPLYSFPPFLFPHPLFLHSLHILHDQVLCNASRMVIYGIKYFSFYEINSTVSYYWLNISAMSKMPLSLIICFVLRVYLVIQVCSVKDVRTQMVTFLILPKFCILCSFPISLFFYILQTVF